MGIAVLAGLCGWGAAHAARQTYVEPGEMTCITYHWDTGENSIYATYCIDNVSVPYFSITM